MSSLQKFHRRTNGGVPKLPPVDTLVPTYGGDGSGSDTIGYWLGNVGSYKLRVAPTSTEIRTSWGSYGTARGTTFVNNGIANTDTLAAFGEAAHTAAYYAKNLTTGGYNTWYLPAKKELQTLYSSKAKTPFATSNSFNGGYHWSSTENGAHGVWILQMAGGILNLGNYIKNGNYYVRAVRRSII
jgi:hypothetical protein